MSLLWIRHRGVRLLALSPCVAHCGLLVFLLGRPATRDLLDTSERYEHALRTAVRNENWEAADLWITRLRRERSLTEWEQVAFVAIAERQGQDRLARERAQLIFNESSEASSRLHLWYAGQLINDAAVPMGPSHDDSRESIIRHLDKAAIDRRMKPVALLYRARLHAIDGDAAGIVRIGQQLKQARPLLRFEWARLANGVGDSSVAAEAFRDVRLWLNRPDRNEFLNKRTSGCQLAVRAICEQAIEPDRLPPSLEMYQSNRHVALDALVAAERLYRAGRFHDAIVHLRNAMRSGFRFPAVANNLACLILETSDDEHELHEALRFSCWAVQQEPRVATYLETLGRIHLRLGHCEESLFWLRFARRLNPECRVDAWIQLALGVMGKT